jgi:hypothetical protein
MKIEFIARGEHAGERLVCEAEVHFEQEEGLVGLKLVGFSMWRDPEGEVYCTFPSRAFGAGSDRRYFDYLRPVNGEGKVVRDFKAKVLEAYRAQK